MFRAIYRWVSFDRLGLHEFDSSSKLIGPKYILDFQANELRGPDLCLGYDRIETVTPIVENQVTMDVVLKVSRGPVLLFDRDFIDPRLYYKRICKRLNREPSEARSCRSTWSSDIHTLFEPDKLVTLKADLAWTEFYDDGFCFRVTNYGEDYSWGDLAVENQNLLLYNTAGKRLHLCKGDKLRKLNQYYENQSSDHPRKEKDWIKYTLELGLPNGVLLQLTFNDGQRAAGKPTTALAPMLAKHLGFPAEKMEIPSKALGRSF